MGGVVNSIHNKDTAFAHYGLEFSGKLASCISNSLRIQIFNSAEGSRLKNRFELY